MRSTLLLAATLMAAAAPAPLLAQDAAPAPAATAERAAPEVPPPPAGMGQIVFYRSSAMGGLVSCRVREGDTVINRLPPGKYFILQSAPGTREFNVRSEARDNLRLEIEEGTTQYVRCTIRMGIMSGRPNLTPTDRADFEQRGRNLELLPPYTPEAGD